MKIRWRLYAVTLVITLATFPSCFCAVKQRVWSSNVWQTAIVGWNKNISESVYGKFLNQGPVFIPGMCTVPFNQAIKCQVHCLEKSHMWPLCSAESQLAERLRSCRLWNWESVHGGVYCSRWHPPAELFHIINQKNARRIFVLGKLRL